MILSIDLGKKGALTVMSKKPPYVLHTEKMPNNIFKIADSFRSIRRNFVINAVLVEFIFKGKGIGKSWNAFKTFAKHKGHIEMASVCIFNLAPIIITAIEWQTYWGVYRKGKQASIKGVKDNFDIDTKSDGVADSVLYGGYYLKLKGKNINDNK